MSSYQKPSFNEVIFPGCCHPYFRTISNYFELYWVSSLHVSSLFDFQLFKVIFTRCCLPYFLNFGNCFELHRVKAIKVSKIHKVVSSYWNSLKVRGCLPCWLSTLEVVFQGGRLPNFPNFQNCFDVYWSRPTNVTKQVVLNSCYFTTRPGGSINQD